MTSPLRQLEADHSPRKRWSPAWSALRHRDFRFLWAATFVSNAGSWMQKMVSSWLVYRLTGSAAWLGLDAFASGFTTVMLLPWGGVVADRINRRQLLVWCNVACATLAIVLAGLDGAGMIRAWHIVAISGASGVVQAMMIPAGTSLLPALVGEADVPNAIALNSLQFNLSRVIGPAVGGAALAYLGAAWGFALNAASFLVLVAAFILIRSIPPMPREDVTVRKSLINGLLFVRGRGDLIVVLATIGAAAFLAAPVVSLLPALVKSAFVRDSGSYATLLGCFGGGAVVAASLSTVAGGRFTTRRMVALSLACVGACEVLLAFSSWNVAVLMVALAGFGFVGAMIHLGTSLLQNTPDKYRGRVTSLQQVCFRGAQPLGALVGGIVGQHLGVRATFGGFGAMLLFTGATLAIGFRTVPRRR